MKVLIVGGGSAGWMTAATLSKILPDAKLTLIESPDIPTIGVGESTIEAVVEWATFIGIDVYDFLKHTDGTCKLSIKFTDFYKIGESFHYPFGKIDISKNLFDTNDWWYKKFVYPKTPNSDYAECILPIQMAYINKNKFNIKQDYAYHFDATKFSIWLRENKCKNVKHIKEHINTVEQNEEGIVSLNGKHKADLYIDCTGFRSLLLGKALKEPFESYEDILPNNSAWATRVPYTDKKKQLVPYTNCTAIENGWVWRVPLWSRLGTGYVYSDKFVSDKDALKEFKSHLKNKEKVSNVEKLEYKNIKSRIGIHRRVWVKNVVAIGLSAGFIEPLEGNGLYSIHEFLKSFSRNIYRGKVSQWDRDNFSYMCKMDFRAFAEFVALHYTLSHRDDTPYWKAHFNKDWSQKLLTLETEHVNGIKRTVEYRRIDNSFPFEGGFHFIAAGMNYSPTDKNYIKWLNKGKYEELKKMWLFYIDNMNKRKAQAIKDVEKEPTLYDWLDKNIYTTKGSTT